MSMKFVFTILLFCSCLAVSYADAQRSMHIHKVSTPPLIDGELEDSVWQHCDIASDFTQSIPEPDKPSHYRSEVRMCYTDKAIYLSAHLREPAIVCLKQTTARDMLFNANADVFTLFLDTYNDHQNGFAFKVSSAGAQHDERLSNSSEYGDVSWDAVWDSKIKCTEEGWQLEMEIPFSALRFAQSDNMTWGINFLRNVRMKNENSYWNRVDQQKQGFLAQTGLLQGLENIRPPKRLFLFPYLSSGFLQQQEEGVSTNRWLRSGGLDIKYGLSESFTLDMTLIPDFSQVISDNLVRNLSPFEQQLSENRPFFTEGTEMFNKAGIFYTRRVGQTPSGYYDIRAKYGDTTLYTIEKNPNVSTLYNAFKISGRTKGKSGFGLFNAVSAPMYATIKDKTTGARFREKTEALTNYNVLVYDKSFRGQSNLNFTNTNVLSPEIVRIANVSSLTLDQFNRKETYSLRVLGKLSQIRENQDKSGTAFGLVFSKITGKLTYSIAADMQSLNFDKSDLGIQFDYNNSSQSFTISYNENKPKSKMLQLYRLRSTHRFRENTFPFLWKDYEATASCFLLMKSFWDITYSIESKPFTPIDFYQLGRWNKRLQTNPYLFQSIDGSSDSRKKLFWSYFAGYGFSNRKHTGYLYLNHSLRYRISSRFDVTLKGELTREDGSIGYAYYDETSKQPIAGQRDVREYSGECSVKYNFNPNTNLTARFRHYNSFIHYLSFHQVNEQGAWLGSAIPFQNGYDENFNLQNIDIFFNWIFRPGSRMVCSYKQWLNDAYLLNAETGNTYFQNLGSIVKKPHAFEFSLRIIYFLDYNKWKRA